MKRPPRTVAVCAALALDRVTPEPSDRWHPVAWFGRGMTALERSIWADSRIRGSGYTIIGVAAAAAAGSALRSPAAALTIALGGSSLRQVALSVAERLEDDDLPAARSELRSLVGRDPSELDTSGIAAAVVESVGENTVDAVVAPLLWTLVAGPVGALSYRAINTMDAMVGHRSERFEHFGYTSARLDDLANWLPARVFAASIWLTNPPQRRAIVRAVREDAPKHPSPNAGVAEAALAAALGVELGGTLRYGDRIEHRPLLGDGQRPSPSTIRNATRTVDRAVLGVAASCLALALATSAAGRRSTR